MYNLSENTRTSDGGLNIDKIGLLHRRSRNFAVSLHLNGTNMPSSAFFSGITEFLHYVGSSEAMKYVSSYEVDLNIRKPLGCCLAREFSADDPHKIRPIPPELYSGDPALPKQLTPGEWTLMVVVEIPERWRKEGRSPALRYGFLSMESESVRDASRMKQRGALEDRVIKENIEGFLSRSVIDPSLKQQILSRWKERLGTLRIENVRHHDYQDFYRRDEVTSIEYPMGVCGMEEVESCLRYQDERLKLAERARIQDRKSRKRY